MNLTETLHRLPLSRLGDDAKAGLCLTSLPWPREPLKPLTWGNRPTGILPLGRWPGTEFPRRLLLLADGENQTPSELLLTEQDTPPSVPAKPTAAMELFEESPHHIYAWERHLLRLRQGDRSVALAMGLRTGEDIHWWEACGLTIREENPAFTVIEMAGSIPHRQMTLEEFQKQSGYHNPYLHRHNWLSGHIYARLHANGVCEIYAHHINSKFVDDGGLLKDAVPVIGFGVDDTDPALSRHCGAWTGEDHEICLGGVRFDVSEVSRLARPEQPGSMKKKGPFLVWQPYAGAELFGGICPKTLTGDPFIFHAEEKTFPRGMARTLRFSLSLSDRSPKVARYLAPAWWYGVCEEFLPEPLLPVSNSYDVNVTASRRWIQQHIVRGGFEDGSIPRGIHASESAKGRVRQEPGWEGEIPYAQFLTAWRTGNESDYQAALRSAYYFTDVCIDHAAKSVRMHGYAPHAFSLPMNRVQGTLAAYLETGDPYLFEAAQAVTANAHWQHKNSWPRMTVGRDACYLRSAVLLYRYTGEDFFRRIAREGALTVTDSQRPNGSFGDQGGGSGMHQWSGYITKPWMGLLATNGLLDYLELFPEDEPLRRTVKKFADWLMQERCVREGRRVWVYQHDYKGGREFFDPISGKPIALPSATPWHHVSLARLLGYCSWTFDDPSYLEAWAESYQGYQSDNGDHSCAATLQFLPWLQAKMWNARLDGNGFSIQPRSFGPYTPAEATVFGPRGPVRVQIDPPENDPPVHRNIPAKEQMRHEETKLSELVA